MKLLPLLTLLTLTGCAPKLTPERIKWAECYCGDSKLNMLIALPEESGMISIDCKGDDGISAPVGRIYAPGCGVLE